jgi:hypothetical protein
MADHPIHNPKDYSEALRKIETTDPVHANTLNPLFERLLNNDAFIKALVDKLMSSTQGHKHSGVDGDAPKIGTAGLEDNAVTTAKIANGAITAAKVAADVATQAELDALDLLKFKTIRVGSTDIVADAVADVFELVAGSNITLTPDATNDKVTIAAAGYTHPATHPATMITEDPTHRFVTDAEKAAWNNKVDKVAGKQLSTEDYTTAEKNKLAGIQTNAINQAFADARYAQLTQTPQETTGDMTLYVSPTGSDANDGLTSGTPLKTIAAAIAKIPKVIDHIVTINIASGTYNEDIVLQGFIGSGSIYLTGDSSNLPKITSVTLQSIQCFVVTSYLDLQATSTYGLKVIGCTNVSIQFCACITPTVGYAGFFISASIAYLNNITVSNRATGIYVTRSANVYATNMAGSGNTTGLLATQGATLARVGNSIGATTAESATNGGVIR